MPDPYRGRHRGSGRGVGQRHAADLKKTVRRARADGREVAAFLCEPLLGCGGQIEPPEGYLDAAFRAVRSAGGVCIADEVQIGFGRVGTHFWGFQTQGVVPDIVTLGKPMGNGHPLAAVVTTPEIAASFATGMEYFNTFGGNPVSCAVGMAVLDVIEEEQLQQNALEVGSRLLAGLRGLKEKHVSIGDVRGRGLFIGVELVADRETLEPAARLASWVVERMREDGILLSTDGPLHNVLKIKPPMVVTEEDADVVVRSLDRVLADSPSSQASTTVESSGI
jgi:4-aminobutyrate aminotransferase-like enzyme